MGSSKSFRMSDRVVNMFDSVKNYYENIAKVTDSEIISKGIEIQFESIAAVANEKFRDSFLHQLPEETIEFFKRICDILETLSYSDGLFLEDEFRYFLFSILGEYCEYVSEKETEKVNLTQYKKAWGILSSRYGLSERDIGEIENEYRSHYVEN